MPTGPRSVAWQPLHDARLIWTEALDGGDPKKKVAHRDKVMSLEAPFTAKPSLVMKVQHRFSGFAWLPEKDLALATEFDRDRRWRTTSLVDLTKPAESRKVLFDLSINDAYGDPGAPMSVTRPRRRQDDPPGRRFDLPGRSRCLARGLAAVPRQDGPEDGRKEAAVPLRRRDV